MNKTTLYAVFWLLNLLSLPSLAASPRQQRFVDNEFFLDITVQEADKSFTDIQVGPCRWSVDGRQFDNSLLRVRNLVIMDDATPAPGAAGYRLALRCQEATTNAFDVQLGFGKGVTPSQILGGQEAFQGIIDDTAVFLAFRYSIGFKRND